MIESLIMSDYGADSVFKGLEFDLTYGGDNNGSGVVDILGNKLYTVGGGSIRPGVSINDQLWEYDLLSKKWTQLQSPIIARRNTIGGFRSKRLYIYGGLYEDADGKTYRTASLTRYNPESNSWWERAPNREIYCHAGCFVDGLLYSHGGYDGAYQNYLDVYNPSTDTWTELPPIGSPKCYHAAAGLNGKFYISGGWDRTNVLKEFFVFDPATVKWERLADLPEPRRNHGLVAYNNKLYLVGGADDGIKHKEIFEYTPETNTWRLAAYMKTPHGYPGLVALENGFLSYSGGGHEGILTKYM